MSQPLTRGSLTVLGGVVGAMGCSLALTMSAWAEPGGQRNAPPSEAPAAAVSAQPVAASVPAQPPVSAEIAEFDEYACNRKTKFRDYRVMLGWSAAVRDHARLTLADSTRQDCWARAALVIGLFGEPADFDRLVQWLEVGPAALTGSIPGPPDRWKDPVLKARQTGYFLGASAVGFLGGMTSDVATRERVVAYLVAGTERKYWADREVAWATLSAGSSSGAESVSHDLAMTCIGALGYVGTTSARAALLQLVAAADERGASEKDAVRFSATHALRVTDRIIAGGGLSKYLYNDGGQALGRGLPR